MMRTRATFGLDLHLDRAGPRVRAGLEAELREAVRSGRLPPGARLPSSRVLALDLGVARNTVAEAYGQLVAEGWLTAEHGAGTWVAERATRPVVDAAPRARGPDAARYDLRPGVPDLSSFPRTAWLAASRRALNASPYDVLGYGDARGLPQLRAALAEYLARARGVTAVPERIVVCAGFAQGLELLCEVLCRRGAKTLVTEAYGHPLHWQIAGANGLRTRALPVDSGGAAIERLDQEDAVLLTPAHQFPLGVPLAPLRRRRVVQWAAHTGGLIIEDDYDGEFRYDRQPVGAMQALAPEHIVYAGTVSKSLAPGLRLGWLVLPADLIDEVVAVKESTGRLSSSLDQLTLAEFIASGGYDRQVRRARLAYRRRRDQLVASLRRDPPQAQITGIAAGLHALVQLPDGEREDEVVARAATHGLAVIALTTYSAGRDRHTPALVVGYATPPDHAFTTAIARLRAVLLAKTIPNAEPTNDRPRRFRV
jgi:GntR family transcriptional regulator / MocR family aminotransferase